MKDKHGTWLGPGYYRTEYRSRHPRDRPATIYWIDSQTDLMWLLGLPDMPWLPVRVSGRRK